MAYLQPAVLLLFFGYSDLGLVQATAEPQVLVNPDSRLIPVGVEALFTCKFRNVQEPYWKVNNSEANIRANKEYLRTKGIFINDDESSTIDGNHDITLTLRVDGSYPRVNSTVFVCKTRSNIDSEPATVLTIAEPPISPNPLLQQPSATSLLLKWSPPFLWSGYFIRSYNISIMNHHDGNIIFHQVNSTSFRDPVMSFSSFNQHHQHCTNFTFRITPMHNELNNQTHNVTGGYLSPPGNFNVSAIVLFKTDGTPLVRALVKLSQLICSYQELNITLVITDRSAKTVVTRDGPIFHRGNDSFEYDITSSNLKREQEYLMTVTVNTTFESSTNSYLFNLYPTNPPCTSELLANGQNPHLFTYKVAMGICLALAVLMLFTLVSVLVCVLIHRQRKRYQEKSLNVSTNRMQNAMVHNPIYDGPVYESVQPHFDTLTASVKQDLSLCNTSSASNSPGSSTPPNTGNGNNSQKMVRYLDQPIQPRSLSLSQHPSTPDNNNTRSTSVCAPAAARVMALKKNGKERNKLHLTLTLNGNETVNSTSGAPGENEDTTVLAGGLPENDGTTVAIVTSDGDENYTVMSPIKGKGSGNTGVMELSPEDTDKYKEEIN